MGVFYKFTLWVDAVLAHIMDDTTKRHIGFGSKTPSKPETNYAHLEKEALARSKKFYARKFVIHSGHKPLMYIIYSSKLIQQCFPQDDALVFNAQQVKL